MFADKINNRIPGELSPLPRKENQGYIDDLSKMQLFELHDLLARQDKLLKNKGFISNLADKGDKIKCFRDKIAKEIERKKEIEDASMLLSKLNIATEGKAAMSELEWTGKHSEGIAKTRAIELDSDDEEDPLKILAQPTGSGMHKKKIVHIPPEESLVKEEDLKDNELSSSNSMRDSHDEVHVKFIMERVDKPGDEKEKRQEPFKAYRTTKSNVHDPEKEKVRKKNKYWEVTAATPPLIVHGPVKTLTISESLKLEKENAARLQELQIQQAAERLAERIGKHEIGPFPSHIGAYRDRKNSESSKSENEEENQVYDDEDDDRRGTVTFTIDTIES